MNKYELTNSTKQLDDGIILHRIRALKDIPRYNVKAGDYGGWIKSEDNLSQGGDCWIADDAIVTGYAKIDDNAYVCDNVIIVDNVTVTQNAHIGGHTYIRDYASISGNAIIKDWVEISGFATISENAHVSDYASVCDNATIDGDTHFFKGACAHGDATIPQGSYYSEILTISLGDIDITAIYPNHIYLWCELIKICSKKELMAILKGYSLIPEKLYEQIWLSMRLCKQWIKDNPESKEEW